MERKTEKKCEHDPKNTIFGTANGCVYMSTRNSNANDFN